MNKRAATDRVRGSLFLFRPIVKVRPLAEFAIGKTFPPILIATPMDAVGIMRIRFHQEHRNVTSRETTPWLFLVREWAEITGISKSGLFRRIAAGTLPAQQRLAHPSRQYGGGSRGAAQVAE